jgi:hypothetical protein
VKRIGLLGAAVAAIVGCGTVPMGMTAGGSYSGSANPRDLEGRAFGSNGTLAKGSNTAPAS